MSFTSIDTADLPDLRGGHDDDRDVVNLPVTDLERAKAFYTAIGFTINFTDHNTA